MRSRLAGLSLLPATLFTGRVFLVSLVWMAVLHFLDFENNVGVNRPFQRLIALVAAHVAVFALPGLAYLGLRRRLPATTLVYALIVVIVASAPVRGWLFHRFLVLLNGDDSASLLIRVTGSITNVTFAVIVAWVGFSAAEQHRIRRQRLIKDRQQLLIMRHEAQARFDSLNQESAEQIRSALLEAIPARPSSTSRRVVGTLRTLIDDVVRPLSRYFQQQTGDWLPPDPPKELIRIDWRSVLGNVLDPRNIQPALVVGLMYWISMANTLMNRGAVIAVISAVHFTVSIPLFVFAKRMALRLAAGRSDAVRAVLFLAALYVSGQVLGLTAWLYTRFQEPQFFYASVGPIFVLVGGTLIAFAQSLIRESAAMEDALVDAASDLRWSLARARERHRQQRRSLAHALHGRVQAALASAVIRLEMAEGEGRDDEAVVTGVVSELRETISGLDLLATSSEPLEVVMERIRATWAGIASLAVDVDGDVPGRLAVDPLCASALNDVLTELVYNSIKHGEATAISIAVTVRGLREVEVAVVDNGVLAEGQPHKGLGSELLDDAALEWSRVREGAMTRTTVVLPCEPLASAVPGQRFGSWQRHAVAG